MQLSDILFGILISTYTIYFTGIVTKEFFEDLRHPYIGTSSAYIYNYFIFDLIFMLALISGIYYMSTTHISVNGIKIIFFVQIISEYNAALFLLKKFNFSQPNLEIKLTYIIKFVLFTTICISVSIPVMNQVYFIFNIDSYLDWSWILVSTFGNIHPHGRLFNFVIKFLPLCILTIFWVYSISKKYNKNDLNYFTKAANLPIATFLGSQFLSTFMILMAPQNKAEIFIILVLFLILKGLFNYAIIAWIKLPENALVGGRKK